MTVKLGPHGEPQIIYIRNLRGKFTVLQMTRERPYPLYEKVENYTHTMIADGFEFRLSADGSRLVGVNG